MSSFTEQKRAKRVRMEKTRRMSNIGQRFATYLPDGYRLIGCDPGYLFCDDHDIHSVSLSEHIVDHLLAQLKRSSE